MDSPGSAGAKQERVLEPQQGVAAREGGHQHGVVLAARLVPGKTS